MNVYISSSWKNRDQVRALAINLRNYGHEVYDFTDPDCRSVPEIPPEKFPEEFDPQVHVYSEYINRPEWRAAVECNRKALCNCDVVVLLLPCGTDAHADWALGMGMGKRSIIVGHPCKGERSPVHLWADALVEKSEHAAMLLAYIERQEVQETAWKDISENGFDSEKIAEPVGLWHRVDRNGKEVLMCGNCGATHTEQSTFCPNCKARMRNACTPLGTVATWKKKIWGHVCSYCGTPSNRIPNVCPVCYAEMKADLSNLLLLLSLIDKNSRVELDTHWLGRISRFYVYTDDLSIKNWKRYTQMCLDFEEKYGECNCEVILFNEETKLEMAAAKHSAEEGE